MLACVPRLPRDTTPRGRQAAKRCGNNALPAASQARRITRPGTAASSPLRI
jgi:hypothetical protein